MARRGIVCAITPCPLSRWQLLPLGACSRPAGPSNGVASAPRPEALSEIVVARPAPPVDASTGSQAASSAEPVVDFERPAGCSEIYETNDVCKTAQALVDARTRLNNRACVLTLLREVGPDASGGIAAVSVFGVGVLAVSVLAVTERASG